MVGSTQRIAWLALVTACAGGERSDDAGTAPTASATDSGSTSSTGDGGTATTDEPSGSESDATAGTTTGTTLPGTTTTAATTDALTGDTDAPVPSCGDGELGPLELCDDGNSVDGDGCNADCRPSGELLWQVTHAGMLGLVDEAMGCAVDGNNSIHVIGFVGVGPDDEDLWLRKYAADGAVLWTQTHAGTSGLTDQGRAVVVDVAETVYAAGYSHEVMADNDIVVRKHAADGSPLWTETYAGAAMKSDIASAAALTATGELVVGGATAVIDAGNDTWLRKYDSTGAVLWTRTYDGAAGSNDATQAVAVTPDGYIYAGGYEAAAGEGNNIWLGKYDADGNLLWSRLYNGAASKSDYIHGVVAMDDGGAVVCGYETSEAIPWKAFLRRYDADGLTVWTEIEEGPEEAGALCYGLDRAPDGDILFAGATIQAGRREPWLRRLAPDGTPRWSTVVAGAGTSASHARCIRPAPDGTLVVAGTLDEGTDSRDIWVARLSP